MGGYFKLWRRKVGIVTLAVATMFAVGWVRATLCHDIFCMRTSQTSFIVVHSLNRTLVPEWEYDDPEYGPDVIDMRTVPLPESDFNPFEYYGEFFDEYCWQSNGFGFCNVPRGVKGGGAFISASVPYWSIVVPLTLLSAWLLLSKPRSARSAQTVPPKAA